MRRKIWRKSAAFMLAVILLFVSGCGNAGQEEMWDSMDGETRINRENEPAYLSEDLPEQEDSLLIYIHPEYATLMNQCLYRFESKYPEVEVEVRSFSSGGQDGYDEFITALVSDMAAGAGPDLILVDRWDLKELDKVAQSGSFADLEPWFQGDELYSREDFTSGVLDVGVMDGSRFYVPLFFYMPVLYGVQERFEETGYAFAEDANAFYRQLTQWGEDGNGRVSNLYDQFQYWFLSSGIPTVDFDTGEVLIDTPEFRLFMEAQKAIYPYQWGSYEAGTFNFEGAPGYHMFSSHEGLYATGITMADISFAELNGGFEAECRPVPSFTGETYGFPSIYAAINQNAPNPVNAYLLLRIMLSEDIQWQYAEMGGYGYPVRQINMEELMERLQRRVDRSGSYENEYGDTITPVACSEEWIAQFSRTLEGAVSSTVSERVLEFVFEEMKPYMEGTASYDTCLEQLSRKLRIYALE